MSVFLFENIIFGPVTSRRLGISLGINLFPSHKKICNFNCIYCECGWSDKTFLKTVNWPSFEDIHKALEAFLIDRKKSEKKIDTITFAGNGEPTLHPQFPEIVDITISLRNKYFPNTRIALLTNGTTVGSKKIFNAVLKVDENLVKLDSGIPKTIKILNQPFSKITLGKYVQKLRKFKGNLTIQALFVKGRFKGTEVNNTTDKEIKKWLKAIRKIKPREVQVYTIARDTALTGMEKIGFEKLKSIAKKVEALGIATQVYG